MPKRILVIAIGLALMSTGVFADVTADAQSDITVETIFANAHAEGLTPVQSFNKITAANPKSLLSTLFVLLSVHPQKSEELVIAALLNTPQDIDAIIEMATVSGVSDSVILTAAITAGIDPTLIAKPSAAGDPELVNIAAPGRLGIGGGSGDGGGSVSPN